jgi:hypothetical protein
MEIAGYSGATAKFSVRSQLRFCNCLKQNKKFGAGNETRTRDLNLGKVALYQLSYSRLSAEAQL